jgi:hypothetical protein
MKQLPNIEQLMEMSEEFDNFAVDFCEKYGLSPVEMSGIFLARMTRMAEDMEYGPLYRKLMVEITQLHEVPQPTTTNNSTSIH